MASPQPQDWQQRFQELEQEIDNRDPVHPEPLKEIEVDATSSVLSALRRSYQQFIAWFDRIPASAKLVTMAAGGLLGLTLIKTVFQLVTSLITLSLLGVILYLAYRFWIAPQNSDNSRS